MKIAISISYTIIWSYGEIFMNQKIENAQVYDMKTINQNKNAFHIQDNIFAITICKPIEEVFNFCRKIENFSIFMKGFAGIEITSPVEFQGTLELKSGLAIALIVQMVRVIPNEMIDFKSTPESDVEMNGAIFFKTAPSNLGTEISFSCDYNVPGGGLSEFYSSFSEKDLTSFIRINLKRLKSYLETGVISTIDGQSSGRESETEILTKH